MTSARGETTEGTAADDTAFMARVCKACLSEPITVQSTYSKARRAPAAAAPHTSLEHPYD